MAVRDKLAARAAPFLEDGEVVQQAFRAQVKLAGTQMAKATYVIVGTERSVVILKTSNWSTTTPKTLVARVPRSTPISLRKWGLWSRLHIGDRHFQLAGRATNAEAAQLVNTG